MIDTVVILCGGRGTRLQGQTQEIPKPLVEIGGRPILWHVIQIYLTAGINRFVLCLGYKAELIEQFVAETEWPSGVEFERLRTGLDTPTGGRLALAIERLGLKPFCATYADGLADINIDQQIAFHQAHGKLATVTAVKPQLPFGVMNIGDQAQVTSFSEKPPSGQWVNGGFFCFKPAVTEYLDQHSALERDPLEQLAAADQLCAYRHSGFWACMDTYKDAVMLNDRWDQGDAPWAIPTLERSV